MFAVQSVADDLDKAIKREMARMHVPAMTLAVVKHGKIVRLSAYGYANLDWNAKATNNTRFEIASMTKMFTGAAIRILIEEGKLNPEDLASKYFEGLPPDWKDLNIRHLLTMSMGIGDDWGTDLIPYRQDVTTPYNDDSTLKAIIGMPRLAPLGNEYHYCSPAYWMLGMIVQKISGEPLPKFINERIFLPAGMTQSSFVDNWAIVPELAQGYRVVDGNNKKGWYLGQYLHSRPDVGMLSTARDLAKWVIALDQRRIVKDPSKLWEGAIADSGKPLDYSYGWEVLTQFGHRIVSHSGIFRTGFHTWIGKYPDDDVSVILFSNTDSSPLKTIALDVASKFIPDLQSFSSLANEVDDDAVDTRLCIDALKSAGGGTIDRTRMTDDAFDPYTMADTVDLLADAKDFTFAGRRKLAKPMIVHGHTLKGYTAIKFRLGNREYVVALFKDVAGKIAYVESTL